MNISVLESYAILAASFVTGIFGPLLIQYIRNIKAVKLHKQKDPISKDLDINLLIDEQLESIQEGLNTDRVWISQFHNGGNFYPTGKSMQKFSLVYEQIRPGIKPMRETYSNIPVSLFTKSLKYLYDNDELLLPTVTSDNMGLRSFADELGNKSSYLFALKSLHGDFLGTMGVEFCIEQKNLTEEETQDLRIKAAAIGSLLSTKLNIPYKK